MTDLAEHSGTIVSILAWVSTGFVFVLGAIMSYQIKRITGVKSEMDKIKSNYLNKFNETNGGINELKVATARIEQKLDDLIDYKIK